MSIPPIALGQRLLLAKSCLSYMTNPVIFRLASRQGITLRLSKDSELGLVGKVSNFDIAFDTVLLQYSSGPSTTLSSRGSVIVASTILYRWRSKGECLRNCGKGKSLREVESICEIGY